MTLQVEGNARFVSVPLNSLCVRRVQINVYTCAVYSLIKTQRTPEFAAEYKWVSISLLTHSSVLDKHTKVFRVLLLFVNI